MMKTRYLLIAVLNMVLLLITSCGSSSDLPSEKDVDKMTMEEKLAGIDEAVARNPPKEMTDEEKSKEKAMAASMEEGNVLKSGSFEGRAHPTGGDVQIIEKDGKLMVVLSKDFKSDAGPELHVILSENPDPKSSRDLHEGVYYDLGVLKSTKGTQTYDIPDEMVGKIKTASIYCKPFKVIFGTASLS